MSSTGSRYVTRFQYGPLWIRFDRAQVRRNELYLIEYQGSRLTGSYESLQGLLRWLGEAV